MKKVLAALTTALLVVIMALTMTGCDKSGSIEKAFKNEGYEVTSQTVDEAAEKYSLLKTALSSMSEENRKTVGKYGAIVCTKTLKTAIIIKFPSSDDIKEILGEDGYKNAEDSGYVNGNCWLAVPLDLDASNIFKNA